MDAGGLAARGGFGEVAGGDRAGAGVLGGVEVAHPCGDVVAEPVRQELVRPGQVRLGLALVAEGGVDPPGL
ncbi:hypothetical protein [Streptomyces griseoruber]|uniref:hypothetical protein n=1 Tax=Streptomyces griseoruber TaxID=1943 RepID=UPI001FD4B5FE|nr:hypothetical protein [Streptomyces griseoruber]